MNLSRRNALALAASTCATAPLFARPRKADAPTPWWQDAIFYEIYPRSFQDGNADGIGDFIGMTDRLDYLAETGITAIWVAACFDSPNVDNGYDVSDYRRIMPDFGTMAEFDAFLARAKKRKIRVILDMVFNHTSDRHSWFEQSRASRDNPFRDFYHWHDSRNGAPPTNWNSVFGGPAWTLCETTGQYYLHTFSTHQPDLNWENPKLRAELYAILKFWADKGVDGFRFDAITSIAKPATLSDMSAADLAAGKPFAEHGPRLNAYLRDMNAHAFANTDLYAVGETWGADHSLFIHLADATRHELSSGFRFDLQMKDIQDGWRKLPPKLTDLRAFNADNAFSDRPSTWPVVWLEDHDFPRSVSRYGSHRPEFEGRSAKLLLTMLLSLRGTPFLYQGQEIGMTNYPFTAIDQFNDIAARNNWHEQVDSHRMSPADMLANLAATTRDDARTPMQWSRARNAGFTTGTPWIKLNPAYRTINVRDETADPASILNFTRAMIALRKAHPTLIHGTYRDISPANTTIYAYARTKTPENIIVILNFSDEPTNFALPGNKPPTTLLLGNTRTQAPTDPTITLAPWESLILSV